MVSEGQSEAERVFLFYWQTLAPDEPEPEPEHRFHPERKWRLDFAWPHYKTSVEIEGGIWSEGRHVRGYGFEADCEKYNYAQLFGWVVLRFTPQMLERDPEGCIDFIVSTLEARALREGCL